MNDYNDTTNKESIVDKMIEQETEFELEFIRKLKSTCNAAKDIATSTLLTWAKNLEYYDNPFLKSHECGKNINLLRVLMTKMVEAFEKFIAQATEINVFKDIASENTYFISLLKFSQVLDTCKYFIFKVGNPIYYEKMISKFSNNYNSYCKFYRNTFYNHLSDEDKKHVDDQSFLKIKENDN